MMEPAEAVVVVVVVVIVVKDREAAVEVTPLTMGDLPIIPLLLLTVAKPLLSVGLPLIVGVAGVTIVWKWT